MKPDIKKAILGGIAGTVMMTLMMHFVAPMMVGQPMDIAALIGGMMGDNYMVGMVMHIMMGVILFPMIYVFVVFRFVPGPAPVRGIVWGVVLWLMAAAVVMPMAGAGFFMSEIGGMKAVIAALMGHVVYGALLGVIAGGVATEPVEA
jgi:hypothetical protein